MGISISISKVRSFCSGWISFDTTFSNRLQPNILFRTNCQSSCIFMPSKLNHIILAFERAAYKSKSRTERAEAVSTSQSVRKQPLVYNEFQLVVRPQSQLHLYANLDHKQRYSHCWFVHSLRFVSRLVG